MLITDVAARNRSTVGALVLLVVAVGAYSYWTLPREAAPEVPIPIVLVTTAYEGVAPADIEATVTIQLERELAGLKGLKRLSSTSAEGLSTIVVEFEPQVVIEDALQYVRDRVDLAKRDLPADADEPSIIELNVADFPIITLSVSGPLPPAALKTVADELEDAIETLPGVLGVDVQGALEPEIRLEVDPSRLAVYDVTLAEVLRLIRGENVNVSAGSLDTEGVRFNIRLPAEITKPEQIDELVVAERGGVPVYLTDLARINPTYKDRTGYSRLDGRESITLAVRKRSGANIIATSDGVRAILAEARRQVPAGIRLEIVVDIADYVRDMVGDLENNILSGLVLVVAVLMIFLGFRASMIVALVIPLSMLISFAAIMALGYTLNMIVLFSLVLSLGMLVDNAIVIVENIYRHRQTGLGHLEAALAGTREVAWPVTTSTLTTVAAFSPLIFWEGMMGDFMKYLPITVIIVLSSSLFVALVVSPTVCSLATACPKDQERPERRGVQAYRRLLELAVSYPGTTVTLAVLLLVAVALLYVRLGSGVEFFPSVDPDRAMVHVRFPQGTNLRETDRLVREVERRLERHRAELKHVVANVGQEGGTNLIFGGGSAGPHVGTVTLVFTDYEERRRPSRDTVAEIRQELADIAGAEIKVEEEKEGPPTGAAVAVRVVGREFARLEEISGRARKLIETVPGLVGLRSDLEAARPELVFRVNRQLAALSGVNPATIGEFLKTAVFGRAVSTYREFNDEYDITVRLPLQRRTDVADLFALRVPNDRGEAVPLSSLGGFEYGGGFGTINRVDRRRVVTLSGDADRGFRSEQVLGEVQRRLSGLLTAEEKAAGYRVEYAGEKEEQEKAQAFLSKAFAVALLLIVLILVGQFNSFKVPLIIMTTVLLSVVGVLIGLMACRLSFGVLMTGIGCISLAGVVVNNAIVLLDYARQLRLRGRELVEAAVEAGRTRLRPVLLTAVTTILGLVPMAVGVAVNFRRMELVTRSQSSEWWRALAIAVIFGLAFATVLTLVVVPALYVRLGGFVRDDARGPGTGDALA